VAADFALVPVGTVRSPLVEPRQAPKQGRESGPEAVVEILPAYAGALEGLADGDELLVLCWMHLARRDLLRVHPRGDAANPERGVFATRSPVRPNPIAVEAVRLVRREGLRLIVRGLDAVDGTPVLDIKPRRHRLDD
jgi:tRNA-Thr(GGU) m(6)t(6)A37 methyltransferase TsaA